MNANTLYEIFATNEKHNFPDLNLGLAQYRVEHPELTDDDAKALSRFIARHYDVLVKAYKPHDQEIYADAVYACVAKDEDDDKQRELMAE